MTPETKKQYNVVAGGLFALLGIVCFATAAYVASVPATALPAPTNPVPIISAPSCRDMLHQMGYTASLTSGGGVSVKDASLEEPQAALMKATVAIGLCKLRLVDFCMGSGCPDGGLSFSLAAASKSLDGARAVIHTPKPAVSPAVTKK